MMSSKLKLFLSLICALLASRCWADVDVITDFAGADVNIGERLFLETRFSQYFFAHSGGNVNANIPGDPTVATLATTTGRVPGPFAGQAVSCRQCHIVDEKGYGDFGDLTLGNRTYADFARHTPIPPRDDGRTQTARNTQVLTDALLPHDGPLFLHYDGEFASVHDLIVGTLTGRNYGWKPEEYQTAIHHIASVIRGDDGMGYIATEVRGGRFDTLLFAGSFPGVTSYPNVFAGFQPLGFYLTDPRTLVPHLVSPQNWMNVYSATDQEIVDTVARLIEAYLRNLTLSQATNGVDFVGVGTPIFNGSPFDIFLIKNSLPQLPDAGESHAQYGKRLLRLVQQLDHPQFVTDPEDGHYETHTQTFLFGAQELEGLKIFLRGKEDRRQNPRANVGNCAACHSLPTFTDFIFHNTGATQEEYDAIHGQGKFQKLAIPGFAARQANYNAYLPPTPQHPKATGRFALTPSISNPGNTDLGLWNVYANPDFPAPQPNFQQILPQLLGLSTPQIGDGKVASQQFQFSITNGTPGSVFYVLASTNLSTWTTIATNTFDAQGGFSARVAISTESLQRFFKLSPKLPATDEMLPRTIGLFKTSTVRDLSHSGPYFHTGRKDSFEQAIQFYRNISDLARKDKVRNGDPELKDITLDDFASSPLAAFLRSLNEDYTD